MKIMAIFRIIYNQIIKIIKYPHKKSLIQNQKIMTKIKLKKIIKSGRKKIIINRKIIELKIMV